MQFDHLKRRHFITLLGGAAAWPLAARAQQAGKLPTIGFFGPNTASAWRPWTAAFGQRLHELGWIEGRNLAIEYRWADARSERFAEIAAEFVRLKVDIIVTGGNAANQFARSAFHSITSSARASSVGGISRPSAFAVLRLITSSSLVGRCMGRSPGFSPLIMRAP
jgi:hypothetical protein